MKRRPNDSLLTDSVLPVDPFHPEASVIGRAAALLARGGVVVYPTACLYGIAADAGSATAVEKVFALKRRPADNPLLVLIPGLSDLDRVVRAIPAYARPLLELWPGGITIVFEAAGTVPAVLTGGTGKIGVRLPAHPVAMALVKRFGGPVTGTSANRSGRPAAARVADLDPDIRRQADAVLDAGPLPGGAGSTVVDATQWPVRLLRQGKVPRRAIEALVGAPLLQTD